MTQALAQLHALAALGAIFWLPCTLALYALAVLLFRRGHKHPLLNPTLLSIAGVAMLLFSADIAYPRYLESVAVLNHLLGTAVVALAIPLHRNLARLKGRERRMISALVAGSLASILAGLMVAVVAGLSASTILSLAPKSATAAVSMEIARLIGGIPSVTAVLTILTGITGAVLGPIVLDVIGVRTPEARGFALGVASHGIATARAFEEGEVAGSFAGLGMALNAVLTALLVPPIVRALGLG
jgi:predicted murein hydrolase (TIGR00659 family)